MRSPLALRHGLPCRPRRHTEGSHSSEDEVFGGRVPIDAFRSAPRIKMFFSGTWSRTFETCWLKVTASFSG